MSAMGTPYRDDEDAVRCAYCRNKIHVRSRVSFRRDRFGVRIFSCRRSSCLKALTCEPRASTQLQTLGEHAPRSD
jgi:hypothetical protein